MARKASILWAAMLIVAHGIANGAVVGLNEARSDFFVSVRGFFPAGTLVTGISFYSNDATTFPEVTLMGDAGVDRRLPQLGTAIRSQSNVLGQPGYVIVGFPAYVVPEDQYLWAVVRFPDNEPLRASGIGGGPGIGWRAERVLRNERSWFSVEGSVHEFSPAFDIMIQASMAAVGKAAGGPDSPATPTGVPEVLTVRARPQNVGQGTTFQLALPRLGRTVIDVYTVSGRHVVRLGGSLYSAGWHEVVWPGVDANGHRVPSGIYLYKVLVDQEERTGKVVVLR